MQGRYRNILFSLLFSLIGAGAICLVYKASYLELPSPKAPILFYANQTRQDLKLLFRKAIQSANHSIYACFYSITDPGIITHLSQKASSGIQVEVQYDPRASAALKSLFTPSATITPIHSKGLMHRKILIIDDTYLFMGSANLTSASLQHHSNIVIGLYAPSLAHFLRQNSLSEPHHITFASTHLEGHLLPDSKTDALQRLIELITHAQKSIRIAMFTFTHSQILQALIQAAERGVDICVIADYYSGCGASKKALEHLKNHAINVHLSQGQQLLHHKWALIDEDTFVIGSANWTKAAFTKNEDFLLIFSSLTKDQKIFLNKLWNILDLESSP